jgi:hypothetical protein
MALEYQAQKEKAAKEAEEELSRKAELIKQIRLLEKSLPAIGSNIKKVDLTETSGSGILGEMSIAEVRLCFLVIQNIAKNSCFQ